MLPSCSEWWYVGWFTTNWLPEQLHSSVFLCFFQSSCALVFISVFLFLCLFLRPESPGDSAAFLSTSRSFSGYTLLAAAVWSERGPAIGQQRRPHPICACSPERTWKCPRASYKVSIKDMFWWQSKSVLDVQYVISAARGDIGTKGSWEPWSSLLNS